MNLNRIDNENEHQYIWRLCEAKENGLLDLDWKGLAEIFNRELCDDETEYKDELLKYYGTSDLQEESIKKVQEILKKCGALDYSKNKMNEMYDESLNILSNISWIKEDKKELLKGFVEYLRTRNK